MTKKVELREIEDLIWKYIHSGEDKMKLPELIGKALHTHITQNYVRKENLESYIRDDNKCPNCGKIWLKNGVGSYVCNHCGSHGEVVESICKPIENE